MSGFAIVFLGAGLGGALRHAVSLGCARLCGTWFPWGTMAVNVFGSLGMGLLIGWFALRSDTGGNVRLFLATGVLGGFTTFSAFSLDLWLLWERGQAVAALTYAVASVAVSLAALAAGLSAVRGGA